MNRPAVPRYTLKVNGLSWFVDYAAWEWCYVGLNSDKFGSLDRPPHGCTRGLTVRSEDILPD